MVKSLLFVTFLFFLSSEPVFAKKFFNSHYNICFTPGENCTELIVNNISTAEKTLLVQAYSFTSAPIANAIVMAKKRGVDVRIILDKSQFSAKYSAAKFLLSQNIPIWEDSTVTIAHNKVMIIDDSTVITGSFNFTKAAQEKNAENVLIITDSDLAKKYSINWQNRMSVSERR